MKSLKSSGKPRRPEVFVIRRVAGDSMLPLLRPGRIVIGRSWFKTLGAGDVVIVQHDGLEKIKRIQRIRDGQLFLVGDNQAQSRDSRSFGWLPISVVRAKVVWPRGLNRPSSMLPVS